MKPSAGKTYLKSMSMTVAIKKRKKVPHRRERHHKTELTWRGFLLSDWNRNVKEGRGGGNWSLGTGAAENKKKGKGDKQRDRQRSRERKEQGRREESKAHLRQNIVNVHGRCS